MSRLLWLLVVPQVAFFCNLNSINDSESCLTCDLSINFPLNFPLIKRLLRSYTSPPFLLVVCGCFFPVRFKAIESRMDELLRRQSSLERSISESLKRREEENAALAAMQRGSCPKSRTGWGKDVKFVTENTWDFQSQNVMASTDCGLDFMSSFFLQGVVSFSIC